VSWRRAGREPSRSTRAGLTGVFGAHSHATTEGGSTAPFGGPAAANSVNAFGGLSQHASSASSAATTIPAFSFGNASPTFTVPAPAAAPAVAPATDRFIFGLPSSAFSATAAALAAPFVFGGAPALPAPAAAEAFGVGSQQAATFGAAPVEGGVGAVASPGVAGKPALVSLA
jgi:hypothetical protein